MSSKKNSFFLITLTFFTLALGAFIPSRANAQGFDIRQLREQFEQEWQQRSTEEKQDVNVKRILEYSRQTGQPITIDGKTYTEDEVCRQFGEGCPAMSMNLSASPTSIDSGDTVRLSWQTQNASKCWLEGSNVSVNGSDNRTIRVPFYRTPGTYTYTYQLTCQDLAGNNEVQRVSVNVTKPKPKPSPVSRITGGRSVICTELNRQGLLSDAMYKADSEYGQTKVDAYTMYGYQLWASPIVSAMQKSEAFARAVNVVARPWMNQMAYEMGVRDEGSLVGKAMMAVGKPVSKVIGMVAATWQRGMEDRRVAQQ